MSPGFESVANVFQRQFSDCGELGAAIAVNHCGEMVIDLWAGTRNKSADDPWEYNTKANIFSASKAVVALAVLQLVEQEALDIDAPIADYWPEFGCNDKQSITVRQVLIHCSGINAFHPKMDPQIIYDWERTIESVAEESPWWPPGSRQGYSPMLFGWLLGEVVRRVSGAETFDDYVQANITAPLEQECWFGVDESDFEQLADIAALPMKDLNIKAGSLAAIMRADPRGMVNRAFSNPPSLLTGTNHRAWREAQIPAANGHSSARFLAEFYGSLAVSGDERLLGQDCKNWCWQQQCCATDATLAAEISFSLGFMRMQPEASLVAAPDAKRFCHPGAGGSVGYGDAEAELGFGYVTRAMGQSVLMDSRAERLLQSVYDCL